MLKTLPWRMIGFGCSVGVLAGLLAVSFELDFTGEICEYNQATKHEDCTTYSLLPFLVIQVFNTLNYYGVAITGIATVFLAIITGWLVFVARDQSNTTRAQLRAYVFVSEAKIIHGIADNNIVEALIEIKNSGQTPAYKLTVVNGIALGPYPPPQPLPLAVPDKDYLSLVRTRMDLGPGEKTFPVTRAGRPLTSEDKANLVAGAMAVWVFGEIRYRDAFRRKRWTKYRLITGGPFGVRGGDLIGCEEGNEAT